MSKEMLGHANIGMVDKLMDVLPHINGQGASLKVVNDVIDANALWFDGTDLELRPGIDVDWSNPQAGREESWAIED